MLELATAADWPEVNRISRQVHSLHTAWRPDIYCESEEPYPYDRFVEDIRQKLLYVAKLDGCVLGYAVLAVSEKSGPGVVSHRILRLDSICVDEPLRGHGIGTAMVRDVRALAKAFGCTQLLLSVHPENDRAVGFYQKCGFRIRTIHMDSNL